MSNIILQTDSYKVSHWLQYPERTQRVYSYFESRGGEYEKVLFFGLQYYLKKYLIGIVVDEQKAMEAVRLFNSHFGTLGFFNAAGWDHVIIDHEGKLPLEIKAVPEGTLVETKNVLFTVENTCEKCFWLTSYVETLLEKVWYPSTVATKSYMMKQTIKRYLDETGNDTPDFKLHDFGYRGSTSEESAGIGGAAHLLNFKGTDTLAAITCLQEYYRAKDMPAFSIPAAEHSTITSWGRKHELEAYENMLEQFPEGLVAVVSDSYNIFNACMSLWGRFLKKKIQGRNGTVVIRPDSGIPEYVVPKVLEILGNEFGYTTNEKGYKILPTQLRIIQGDGVDEQSLVTILEVVKQKGWSADNLAFGSGGGLLQQVNRDTCKFAYKCSNVTISGEDRGVSKSPVDSPDKKSKEGRLMLVKTSTGYITGNKENFKEGAKDELQVVYRNGELLVDQTFEEIRARI